MISNKKPTMTHHHYEDALKNEAKVTPVKLVAEKPVVEPVKEKVDAPGEVVKDVSQTVTTQAIEDSEPAGSTEPTTHYFYCKKPDGTKVTYKRSLASKGYAAEVAALKKNCEEQGIVIVSEEKK